MFQIAHMQLMVNLLQSCRQELAQKCDAHSKTVTATEHF